MMTVKFYTLGCKVNQYETQAMRERFIRAGFKELENGRAASLYVINTCTVTAKADADSLNLIRRAKRENPRAKVIATGCLAELDGEMIKKQSPASLIVKNKNKENILDYVKRTRIQHNFPIPRETVSNGEGDKEAKPHLFGHPRLTSPVKGEEILYQVQVKKNYPAIFLKPDKAALDFKGISYFKGHTRAFLKIQDGCNNFCSYCKVPLARGASRSRPLDEIIREAGRLAVNGYREIVLSGICLGAYGRDLGKNNLVNVIAALEEIEGFLRIRLSSIEAGDVTDELIDKIAFSKKVCRHLHIPVQSGDDGILKKMNRKYCRADYLGLVKKIKRLIPAAAITTDVLAGFPGESEVDFKNTIDLIKEITPLKAHIFPYSMRRGTFAAKNFNEIVSPSVVKNRILKLKETVCNSSTAFKKQFLHKDMDVLIEDKAKGYPGFWQGYTDNYIKVLVKADVGVKNRIIPVRLKKLAKDYVLAENPA